LKCLITGDSPIRTNFVAGISAHSDSLVCVGVNHFITGSEKKFNRLRKEE